MSTRILAIDDDDIVREFVAAALRPAGYEVMTASGGLLGLEQAFGVPPDVILLDVQMPEVDGYEVCRRLRQDVRTRKIPVVMLTASEDPKLSCLAYDAGAQACVPKPFRREALIATIEAVRLGWPRGKKTGGAPA
jgi:CheY-like chemotaxis protein